MTAAAVTGGKELLGAASGDSASTSPIAGEPSHDAGTLEAVSATDVTTSSGTELDVSAAAEPMSSARAASPVIDAAPSRSAPLDASTVSELSSSAEASGARGELDGSPSFSSTSELTFEAQEPGGQLDETPSAGPHPPGVDFGAGEAAASSDVSTTNLDAASLDTLSSSAAAGANASEASSSSAPSEPALGLDVSALSSDPSAVGLEPSHAEPAGDLSLGDSAPATARASEASESSGQATAEEPSSGHAADFSSTQAAESSEPAAASGEAAFASTEPVGPAAGGEAALPPEPSAPRERAPIAIDLSSMGPGSFELEATSHTDGIPSEPSPPGDARAEFGLGHREFDFGDATPAPAPESGIPLASAWEFVGWSGPKAPAESDESLELARPVRSRTPEPASEEAAPAADAAPSDAVPLASAWEFIAPASAPPAEPAPTPVNGETKE